MSIERWEIASSSQINFTVRHLLFSKVRGRFTRWSGTLQVPDGDWGRATVDVAIDASSIDTGVAKRDADLRSAHFLDVERYPVITFRTLYVTARQADAFQIVGELSGGRGDTRDREQRRHSRSVGVRACPILRQDSHQTAGLWRQWERRLGQIRHHDR
jgi:polyisoprenoid-binding protein YceI